MCWVKICLDTSKQFYVCQISKFHSIFCTVLLFEFNIFYSILANNSFRYESSITIWQHCPRWQVVCWNKNVQVQSQVKWRDAHATCHSTSMWKVSYISGCSFSLGLVHATYHFVVKAALVKRYISMYYLFLSCWELDDELNF